MPEPAACTAGDCRPMLNTAPVGLRPGIAPARARAGPEARLGLRSVPQAVLPARIGTILLVEDSRHAAEAVRLAARRLGLRLRRAEDLASARRHLRVYRPDVVLIDLGLPDGTGLDLLAELVGLPTRPRRCVAISADPDARAEALAAGAQAFVEKPLRLPGDLSALLGCAADGSARPAAVPAGSGISFGPRRWKEATGPDRGREADPLALRDDLLRARMLLTDGDAGQRHYAARFLAGLGRSLGDAGLQRSALSACEREATGATASLIAALDARVAEAAWF